METMKELIGGVSLLNYALARRRRGGSVFAGIRSKEASWACVV